MYRFHDTYKKLLWSFHFQDHCILFTNRHLLNSQSGIQLLGAGIGPPSFVASCLQKRVNELEKLIENPGYLNDPQFAKNFRGTHKDVFTPLPESNKTLEQFDLLQRTTLKKYRAH